MLRKILIFLITLFGITTVAFAAPSVRWERTLLPVDSTENLGTTTSPWDELHVNEICLTADCKTAWPVGGGGGVYPFVPATTYNIISSGTSTPLWLQGSPFSLFASSTAVFTNASTSQLTVSGNQYNPTLTSALILTGATGLMAEYTGVSCTNQVIEDIDALGAGTCVSINNGYWSGTDLAVANGGTGVSSFGGTNRILYTSTANTLADEAAFTYDQTTNKLTADYASSTSITTSAGTWLATSGGQVGIGTTTTSYPLSVFSGTLPQLSLSNGTGIPQWTARNAGGNLYLATTTVAGTATTTPAGLTILGSTGRVGIGTNSPIAKLHVVGPTGTNDPLAYFHTPGLTDNNSLFIGNGTTNNSLFIAGSASAFMPGTTLADGGFRVDSTADIFFGDPVAARMVLESTGDVGIGTTNPSAKVHTTSAVDDDLLFEADITSGNQADGLYLSKDTDAGRNWVTWHQGSGAADWRIGMLGSPYDLTIYNGNGGSPTPSSPGTAFVTVQQSTGNFGIATTSPWRKLSVVGTVAFNGLTTSTAGNAVCILATFDVVTAGGTTCTTSSAKTKHDISKLTTDTETILALTPVQFTYNEKGDTRYGLIAEDVAKIDPIMVELAEKDITLFDGQVIKTGEPLTVDYQRSVMAKLIKFVQDMWYKVANHESRIEKLEREIEVLKEQLKNK